MRILRIEPAQHAAATRHRKRGSRLQLRNIVTAVGARPQIHLLIFHTACSHFLKCFLYIIRSCAHAYNAVRANSNRCCACKCCKVNYQFRSYALPSAVHHPAIIFCVCIHYFYCCTTVHSDYITRYVSIFTRRLSCSRYQGYYMQW